MGTDAPVAEEILAPVIGDDGKWRSGFRGVRLDCLMVVVWDLFADWGNWSWQTSKLSNELREGESGKPGYLRLLTYPVVHLYEGVVEVDDEQHFLQFAIEENNLFGGMKGYFTSCVKEN